MLPCFTVGFDVLPWSKHFPTVHTGTVVHGDTVSTVVLVLVMWTVTAALTGHSHSLERTTTYISTYSNFCSRPAGDTVLVKKDRVDQPVVFRDCHRFSGPC